ncbi:MAG: hypothetical protein ACREIT_05275 [Tepidisphaeraceae bacterium]
MSQYPPPYSSGYYPGYPPASDPLAPARRASILMFILGGLMFVCGTCAGFASTVSQADLPAEQASAFQQVETELARAGLTFRQAAIAFAILALAPGLSLIVLGYFVRSGGIVSIVLSLLVSFGLTLLIGFLVVSAAASGLGGGRPELVVGLFVWAVPLALLVLLDVLLVQAARRTGQVEVMRQQQSTQWWQYQQQQAAYQQGAYQYPGAVPPPPPPPAPPPPPDPGDLNGSASSR